MIIVFQRKKALIEASVLFLFFINLGSRWVDHHVVEEYLAKFCLRLEGGVENLGFLL
jgi:hypothetical protein